jgi:hypothetical protein
MIKIEDEILYCGEHQISIGICMEMKSLLPTMNFSQIINGFDAGESINPEDFNDAVDYLDKQWLKLKPSDVEWKELPDEDIE